LEPALLRTAFRQSFLATSIGLHLLADKPPARSLVNKVSIARSGPDDAPASTEDEYQLTPKDEAALRRIADIRESLRQEQQLQEQQPHQPA